MAEENGAGVDLFGDPLLPLKDPRGRKAHRRCAQVAESVAILAAGGFKNLEIARRVGLSDKTLTKYYSGELADGGRLVSALTFETQVREALKGKTSAYRAVRDQLAKGEAVDAAYGPARARGPTAPKLGKKEQRLAAAEEAVGGMFAPGAPPASLVN
jgi:hypothetical protein